jgi:recombinational DNA repair protein RecR
LIDQFERLPGIGPRTAQRLALHLLRQPEEQIQAFADALLAARSQVGECQRCFHLSAEPLCDLCRQVVVLAREILMDEQGLHHPLRSLSARICGCPLCQQSDAAAKALT